MTAARALAHRAPSRAAAAASVIGAVALWSTSFAVTKASFAALPPMTVAALRFLVALAPLGAARLLQRPRERPPRATVRRMAGGGLLGITAYFVFENYGLRFASATDGALVVGAFPIIALVLEWLLHARRPSPRAWAGVLLAAAGVVLIVARAPASAGALRPLGVLLCALAGVAWALYNFATREVARAHAMSTLLWYQTLAGAAGLLPLALLEWRAWRAPPLGASLAVVYLGVLCSWAGYALYAHGLRTLGASAAVTLLNLVPVFGVIFAVLFLHESVTATQLAGGAVVLGGVAITLRRPSSG